MSIIGDRSSRCPGRDPYVDDGYVDVTLESGRGVGPGLSVVEAILEDSGTDVLDELVALIGTKELRDSAIELVIALASLMSQPSVEFNDGTPGEETTMVVTQILEALSYHTLVSFLLVIAQDIEATDDTHKEACQDCRSMDFTSPMLVRARLCRDIADEIALGETVTLTVRDVPVIAALDLVQVMLRHGERSSGQSVEDQIAWLRRSLTKAIGARE